MEFNEFTLKPLRMKLYEMFPQFIGLNVIKSYQGGSVGHSTHFMIFKLNINGVEIYFEQDIFDNKDVFDQCVEMMKSSIRTKIPYFNIDVSNDFAEDQIVSALIYRTGKTVENYNNRMFDILGREAAFKNPKLADLQKYIEDKFAEGGDWEKMLEGAEGLEIKSVISRRLADSN